MEKVVSNIMDTFIHPPFWYGRKVFITGHTGFKGAWLSMWLLSMGAVVSGYSLAVNTNPALFDLANLDSELEHIVGDIRDFEHLKQAMHDSKPEVVFHLAAQPIVRESYLHPIETYDTNVMGTVNLLEAVRQCSTVRAVVVITTDKCYDNKEWVWGYRESDPMGGYDPYSSSKGCAELVVSSFRNSYFPSSEYSAHHVGLASARAGNVIGGGDWAADRLIPDILRSFSAGKSVEIRRPDSVRPWQHVLEPLCGYLRLAESLSIHGCKYAEGFNFGPRNEDAQNVGWIVQRMLELWGPDAEYHIDTGFHPHEANYLKLDISKAKALLDWYPVWDLRKALNATVEWEKHRLSGENARDLCLQQISAYMHDLVRIIER